MAILFRTCYAVSCIFSFLYLHKNKVLIRQKFQLLIFAVLYVSEIPEHVLKMSIHESLCVSVRDIDLEGSQSERTNTRNLIKLFIQLQFDIYWFLLSLSVNHQKGRAAILHFQHFPR